jgi:hypothetical protein
MEKLCTESMDYVDLGWKMNTPRFLSAWIQLDWPTHIKLECNTYKACEYPKISFSLIPTGLRAGVVSWCISSMWNVLECNAYKAWVSKSYVGERENRFNSKSCQINVQIWMYILVWIAQDTILVIFLSIYASIWIKLSNTFTSSLSIKPTKKCQIARISWLRCWQTFYIHVGTIQL